jgi:hypothetical protein
MIFVAAFVVGLAVGFPLVARSAGAGALDFCSGDHDDIMSLTLTAATADGNAIAGLASDIGTQQYNLTAGRNGVLNAELVADENGDRTGALYLVKQ